MEAPAPAGPSSSCCTRPSEHGRKVSSRNEIRSRVNPMSNPHTQKPGCRNRPPRRARTPHPRRFTWPVPAEFRPKSKRIEAAGGNRRAADSTPPAESGPPVGRITGPPVPRRPRSIRQKVAGGEGDRGRAAGCTTRKLPVNVPTTLGLIYEIDAAAEDGAREGGK